MGKLNSFAVTKIETKSDKELLLTALINNQKETFVVDISVVGSVSFPDELEIWLINKDFNAMRELLQLISDYVKGSNIILPSELVSKGKNPKHEKSSQLQAA